MSKKHGPDLASNEISLGGCMNPFLIGLLILFISQSGFTKTSFVQERDEIEKNCPFETLISERQIGTKTFTASSAERVLKALNDSYETQRKEFRQILLRQDQNEIEFEAPILKLRIQPTGFKKNHSCQRYFAKHTYPKVFTAEAKSEAECKARVYEMSSEWTQGTLVGSTTIFVSGGTPEGDDLYKKCPGNCSYSSEQSLLFSWNGRTCQLRSILEVTCGAPKEKNEFLASAKIEHKHICELKR
jgi:hypothetical protein